MYVLKRGMWGAAVVAALAAGAGCDGGADTGVSPDLAAARGVPPNTAAAVDPGWPDELGGTETADADVEDGRQLYLSTCAACHGAGGQGMPNQGPDLRGSAFVGRSTDDQLVAFLASGRAIGAPANPSGLPWPPRGGYASLSDRHLGLVVKYLRIVEARRDAGQGSAPAEQAHAEQRS
jgi:mono/diheme cytochrome c family protein